MTGKRAICLLFVFSLSLFSSAGLASGQTKPMGFAVPFPDLRFQQGLSKEDQVYLGLPRKTNFSLKEIRGNLIVIDLLSAYCTSCEMQAPIFNETYSRIEKDPDLKGKVKIIGIAAGNNQKEVEVFRNQQKIPYPIFTDSKFNHHSAIGSPRAPFTIWAKRDFQGKWIVISTHLGPIDSVESALEETRAVLQYDLSLLKPKKGPIYVCDVLKPPLPEEEMLIKVKGGMESSGGKVLQVEKLSLRGGDWIYAGKVDFGTHQGMLFSKVAMRRAVCDICHDTYFIYIFDPTGKVVEILPIYLTKFRNLQWEEKDIQKLRSRVLGKSILGPFNFDPSVDSVSGATITVLLIFDCLDKAKDIYEKLKSEGYLEG
jgi:thiol-disulfide isomerase/thioredoxin